MGLASNQLLKTIYKGQNPNDKQKRLAQIVEVQGSTARVKFYGEENASEKFYTRVGTVSLTVGQSVFMEKISGTYVIMGRVG